MFAIRWSYWWAIKDAYNSLQGASKLVIIKDEEFKVNIFWIYYNSWLKKKIDDTSYFYIFNSNFIAHK